MNTAYILNEQWWCSAITVNLRHSIKIMFPSTETLYGHSIVLQTVNRSKAQVKVELSKFEIQEKLK